MATIPLVPAALLSIMVLGPAFKVQMNITAGQNITLPCRAPNNNKIIIVMEWSRPDLPAEYVLCYRDEQFDLEYQHPSFKNRVDLQDRQMKDGDVSLILYNVTTADAGTYECRVIQKETSRRKRAHLKTDPISSIYLSVVDPPGQTGGDIEDGQEEDRVNRGRPGLSAFGVICVLIAVFVISGKLKNKNSSLAPPEQQQA